MKNSKRAVRIRLLRWALGSVVLWESIQFAVSKNAPRHLHAMGLPGWIAPVLGGIEIAAVVLFLIPKFRRTGAWTLFAVFAVAVALHVLHGQFEIGSLVVYSAAVLVCMQSEVDEREEVLS